MTQLFYFWVYTPKQLKAGTPTDICTLILTAALFTI